MPLNTSRSRNHARTRETGIVYKFKTEVAEKVYRDLVPIVPIRFQLDNSMDVNAGMDFDEQKECVVVKYKNTADERIDLMHELLHVRMQFRDGFPLLAWQTSDPVATPDIRVAVSIIRDTVDDMYVFHALYMEFDTFPISPNFFRQCRKDIRAHRMHHVENKTGINKTLVAAWRLRIAQLSQEEFFPKMTTPQKEICEEFLSLFTKIDPEIQRTLSFLRSCVTPEAVATPIAHGQALEKLRDHLDLSPNVLHLAVRKNIAKTWVLQRI